jgi:hypothetical protein
MANQTPFDMLLLKGMRSGVMPARSDEAKNWFRNKAKTEKGGKSTLLQEKERLKSNVEIGKMYFFSYQAITESLPFWDAFPLIFPFAEDGKYFYGINLHYLPLQYRAKLMDALYTLVSDTKYDQKTKLNLSYSILKSASKFSYFQPCVKKYLKSGVRSKFIEVNAAEWDIALFLPFASWQKGNANEVYKSSRKKINAV